MARCGAHGPLRGRQFAFVFATGALIAGGISALKADPTGPSERHGGRFKKPRLDYFDATRVHPRAKGFQCGDFDPRTGRVFFYPWGGYLSKPESVLLAYDTRLDFQSPRAYEAADLTKVVSPEAQGFGAGFLDADSPWMYLVPFRKEEGGKIIANDLALRYDRSRSMSDPDAFQTFHLRRISPPPPLTGWITGAVVNGHAYYIPYGEPTHGPPFFRRHGYLLRYDLHEAFSDPRAWEWVDLTALVDAEAFGFQSCAVKGRWLYLIPYDRDVLIRYDTQNPFRKKKSYESVNLSSLHPKAVGYTGGLVAGDILVLVPYRNLRERNLFRQSVSLAAAFDTRRPLRDRSAWSFQELTEVSPEAKGGYQFGWVDRDETVHFCPTFNFSTRQPPAFVSWDSRRPFDDPQSWTAHPREDNPTSTGAAYDGRSAYLVPWGRNGNSGNITRLSFKE